MTRHPPGKPHKRTEVKAKQGYGIDATKAWGVFVGRMIGHMAGICVVALAVSFVGVSLYDFVAGQLWLSQVDLNASEPVQETAYAISAPNIKPEIVEDVIPNVSGMIQLEAARQTHTMLTEFFIVRVVLGALTICAGHVALMRMKSLFDA